MSKLPPDKELPLTLRADRQLSQYPDAAARPSAIALVRTDRAPQAGDRTAGPSPGSNELGVDQATAIGLGLTGIALVTGLGWFVERRRRLSTAAATGTRATPISTPAWMTADAAADTNAEPVAATTEVTTDVTNEAAPDIERSELPAGPVPTRRRSNWIVSVPGRQRLIALFMGMRQAAGAVAILAAIAVVVFWTIESTEQGPRDTALTLNLLVVLFAAWAGYWIFGGLANWLHRATFNRVHPKFDT